MLANVFQTEPNINYTRLIAILIAETGDTVFIHFRNHTRIANLIDRSDRFTSN